jgi:hypothetical protein
MTTIYDSTRQVKPSTFGRGILRSLPSDPAPFPSFADRQWWAAESNGQTSDLDRHVDEMFAESEAIGRLEMGLCC